MIAKPSLYRRVLGSEWARLPPSLRRMHDLNGAMTAEGTARVETGKGLLAGLVRRLVGFPEAAETVAVKVSFISRDGDELWTRQFGSAIFSSTQRAGRGRDDRLIVEQFGPARIWLALVLADGRLRLVARRWSLLALPWPLFLAPGGETYEFEASGRFHFHVEIRHPWMGLIVKYSGALDAPESVGASAPAP